MPEPQGHTTELARVRGELLALQDQITAALEAQATGNFSEAELATLRQLLDKLYVGLSTNSAKQDNRLAG